MKDFPYLKNLNKLKTNSQIYIYGSGTFGRSFYFSIKTYRSDIDILGFIDSYQNGEIFDLPIIKIDDFVYSSKNYNNIIICADSMHWSAIVNKLNKVDLKDYFVNLYWDFDLYNFTDNDGMIFVGVLLILTSYVIKLIVKYLQKKYKIK